MNRSGAAPNSKLLLKISLLIIFTFFLLALIVSFAKPNKKPGSDGRPLIIIIENKGLDDLALD